MILYIVFILLLAVISFFIYWYFKFKYILPMETKLSYMEKLYSDFHEFLFSSMSFSSKFYNENIINLINMFFIKLNSVFPKISVYIFERRENIWGYVGGVNSEKSIDIDFKKLSRIFESNNKLSYIEDMNLSENEYKRFAFIPLITEDKDIAVLVFFEDDEIKDVIMFYLKFIMSFLNFIKKYYEIIDNLKSENKRLKLEIDSIVKELEHQGERLIKKNRETSAVYKGIEHITASVENPVYAMLEILINSIENCKLAIFYHYDINKNVLYPHSFISEKQIDPDKYSIYLHKQRSVIADSFLNKEFIEIKDYYEGENILEDNRILNGIISPIYNRDERFGVLVVGKTSGEFTKDEIKLIELISRELSIMVNMYELYSKLSKDAVELANLNKIKDEFLSSVSHEFKTPLTTVKGFISVLLSGEVGPLNQQQMSFLSMVDNAANRLINMVNSLLDISKLNSVSSFETERADLKELVDNAVNMLKFKAYSKNIKIDFKKDDREYPVMVEKQWITQVINNLIDNAIKYSPSGSTVKVEIYDKENVIVFSVSDEGPGIDEADREFVFEKFYRGKNVESNVEGSGLGLTISKNIIEKHNGKIWFESTKGKGSKFYFALEKAK